MGTTEKPFIIPVFIPHAGCPHLCVFCNQTAITHEKRKPLLPEMLRKRIQEFIQFKKKNRSAVQVAFYGGNFLGQKTEDIHALLSEAAKFILAGSVDSIRFSTRPDTIDPKRLDILKAYPVETIELGVQSMDDDVLTLSRRGHTAADTEKAVSLLKKHQYEIGLQMMIGLPGDSEAIALDSGRRIAGMHPDFVRIYPTLVLAGSPLAKLYEQKEYEPLALDAAVSRTKKLYLLFKDKDISVIRMGLQASEDLDDGATVLAGPYHPAFGHLVHAEIFLDKAKALLKIHPLLNDTVVFCVNPRSVSRMQGIRNHNISALKLEFSLKTIRIAQDDALSEGELSLG